jgi:putative radical SAM enzyme (TIGR03279 family)
VTQLVAYQLPKLGVAGSSPVSRSNPRRRRGFALAKSDRSDWKSGLKSNAIKLLGVKAGSAAEQAGLAAGDVLRELDGRPLEDVLDLKFYLHDSASELAVDRGGRRLTVRMELGDGADPGWELESLQMRTCHCDCVFCFVHQLPENLRPSLSVKDEDYRFSFLFGNYLTLVRFSSRDLERVVRMRLSPLYVSIHATDPILRGRLLGVKKAPILPLLGKLIGGGIRIHGQIVVVPGWNDGEVLEKSLADLAPLCPGLASLAVVPVGLTKHREHLPELRSMNAQEAKTVLLQVERFQRRMMNEFGGRWVHPADELLLLAGAPIPPEEAYEGYPQLENGVGLMRHYLGQAQKAMKRLPASLPRKRRILWVTGLSASKDLKDIAAAFMGRIRNLEIQVLPVENNLLGPSVTVAGLLSGQDIAKALKDHFSHNTIEAFDAVFLPPDCINGDGLMLDDWTVAEIGKQVEIPAEVFQGDWAGMVIGRDREVLP